MGETSFLVGFPLTIMRFPRKPKNTSLLKKEAHAQVFYWEFCEISKNPFYYRTPLVAATVALWTNAKCFSIRPFKHVNVHDTQSRNVLFQVSNCWSFLIFL